MSFSLSYEENEVQGSRKRTCLLQRNYFVRISVENDAWRNASFSFYSFPFLLNFV